jgi:hypothetical protein
VRWPFDSEKDVQDRVEQLLRHPVDPVRWRFLIGEWEGITKAREEVEAGIQSVDEALEWMAERYQRVPGTSRPRGQRSGTVEHLISAPDQRLEVLSRLVAEEAARDPWVVRFRAEHLNGGLLAPTPALGLLWVVVRWIRGLVAQEGGTMLSPHPIVLPGEETPRDSVTGIAGINVWTGPWGNLWCSPPLHSDDWSDAAPVMVDGVGVRTAPGGVLEELRRESARLAEALNWSHSVTAWFVLTGRVPLIQRAVGELRWKQYAGVELSRLHLDVHPTTSPAEVMRQYRHLRGRWLRAVQPHRSRSDTKRPLGVLVEFVRARPDRSWAQRFAEWNEQHPDHRYTHASNMQRDYARAMRLANGGNGHH